MTRVKPLGFGVVGVALFLVLGGPGPGSVGDCTQGASIADATQHCRNAGAWRCARRRARGDITEEEERECVSMVEANCPGTNWPAGCAPTQQQADACIAALSVDPGPPGCTTCDNPPECANLCAGSSALTSGDPESPKDAGPSGSDAEVMP
jgi:hypothetical protein